MIKLLLPRLDLQDGHHETNVRLPQFGTLFFFIASVSDQASIYVLG